MRRAGGRLVEGLGLACALAIAGHSLARADTTPPPEAPLHAAAEAPVPAQAPARTPVDGAPGAAPHITAAPVAPAAGGSGPKAAPALPAAGTTAPAASAAPPAEGPAPGPQPPAPPDRKSVG